MTDADAHGGEPSAASGAAVALLGQNATSGAGGGTLSSYGEAGADGLDPGLPARDLQARRRGRTRLRDGPREAPRGLAGLGERDGQEARGARSRRAPALPRDHA